MDHYSFWIVSLTIAGLGAFGALGNLFQTGEFHVPKVDKDANVWRPGWCGVVFVGALAALVVFFFSGTPSALSLQQVLSGDSVLDPTMGQLGNAVIVGWGGGRILSSLVETQILRAQTQAERTAKNELSAALRDAIS